MGFCNSKWVQAVVSQVSQLQHTSNLFYTLPDSLLAERLCEVTGYSKVFFGNSGAEANEGAQKLQGSMAWRSRGSIATVLLHWKIPFMGGRLQRFLPQVRIYSTSIFPFTEGFLYVPANNSYVLHETVDDTVCAVMLELVQGRAE